jgi:hypothetical protein
MSISGQQKHGLGITQQTACLTQITRKAELKPKTALLDNSVLVRKKISLEKICSSNFLLKTTRYRDRTMAGTIELCTYVQNSIIIKVLHCSQICNCRLLPTLNFITLIIIDSE